MSRSPAGKSPQPSGWAREPGGLTDLGNLIGNYLPLYPLLWYYTFEKSKEDWYAGKTLGAVGHF